MITYPYLAWYRLGENQYCFPRAFKTKDALEEWLYSDSGPPIKKRIKNNREESIIVYFISEEGSFPVCVRQARAIPLKEEV